LRAVVHRSGGSKRRPRINLRRKRTVAKLMTQRHDRRRHCQGDLRSAPPRGTQRNGYCGDWPRPTLPRAAQPSVSKTTGGLRFNHVVRRPGEVSLSPPTVAPAGGSLLPAGHHPSLSNRYAAHLGQPPPFQFFRPRRSLTWSSSAPWRPGTFQSTRACRRRMRPESRP